MWTTFQAINFHPKWSHENFTIPRKNVVSKHAKNISDIDFIHSWKERTIFSPLSCALIRKLPSNRRKNFLIVSFPISRPLSFSLHLQVDKNIILLFFVWAVWRQPISSNMTLWHFSFSIQHKKKWELKSLTTPAKISLFSSFLSFVFAHSKKKRKAETQPQKFHIEFV